MALFHSMFKHKPPIDKHESNRLFSKLFLNLMPSRNGSITFLKLLIPKSSFTHLKRGIKDFHVNYVLVPADKAANNVVVV